jgi:transposase InsO family protein
VRLGNFGCVRGVSPKNSPSISFTPRRRLASSALIVFNTDQGSQFTGSAFTGVLANNDIAISMDGKGAWRDNVFVERLWRSIKYEEVYLRAYDTCTMDDAHTRALTA